ncbi:hypothetical protein [Sphingomonas sp.]|uniref:hypothetical protein n=1 Tax=Sphingomonas sp. TaxID=28214 RepID=UPI003D6CFDCA
MKRTLARIAFVATILLVLTAISVAISMRFPGHLVGGLSGSVAVLILLRMPKLFDKIWPKPMQGWAE